MINRLIPRQIRLIPAAVLFISVLFVTGCGDDGADGGGPFNAEVGEFAIELPKTFQGELPDVPAEMGGEGFEALAADEGWETNVPDAEHMRLIASPEAVKGGEMSFGVQEWPATFRAYGKDEQNQTTRLVYNMVYENLIDVDPITLKFLPKLATHWRVSEDGQTYFFRLDPNARFSDGYPVTTADVLATYELATDSTILAPYTNAFYQTFDPPEAVSPYILKVRSKEKNWKNMLYFGGTAVLPAHVIDGMSGSEYLDKFQYEMPPGSGPYTVRPEDIKKGQSVSLLRRLDYWRSDYPTEVGFNNFDKITLKVVRDERLMLEKFKAGDISMYLITRAQWYEEEFSDPLVKRGLIQVRRIYNDEPQGASGFVFNMRKPPFDDPKLRLAFTKLFNRKSLLENLMYNQYQPTHSFYPGSVYENPNNPQYTFDPQGAAELLREAGYTKRNQEGILVHEKTGKPLEIEMPLTQDMVRIISPVQSDLRKAGIKLTMRQIDGPSLFKLLQERNFELGWINWGGLLYPNPKSSFHSELADQPNTSNLAGFKNQRADELIDREQVTFDQEARVRMLRELDSLLIAENQYALAWYAPFTRLAYWNMFGHPEYYLGKISDWRYVMTAWWIDPVKKAKLAEAYKNEGVDLGEGERDVRFWPQYNEKNAAAATEPEENPAAGDS